MTILRTLPVRAALLPFMGWTLLFAVISWCRPTLLRVPKKHCGTSWGVDVGWKTDWGILNAPASGEAMAELILDGVTSQVDLRAFDPARLM